VSEDFTAPAIWPPLLPGPHSPDLPQAALRWLDTVVPADRWRHGPLHDQPWLVATMAAVTLRRQIEALRQSYRETRELYGRLIPADRLDMLLQAHVTEAQHLEALLEQVLQVEQALFQAGGARPVKPLTPPE
jgi:hypothetical protein